MRKTIAKFVPTTLLLLALTPVPGLAAASESGHLSPGLLIFLGFLALVILLQLLPGLILFGGFIAALLGRSRSKAEADALNEGRTETR